MIRRKQVVSKETRKRNRRAACSNSRNERVSSRTLPKAVQNCADHGHQRQEPCPPRLGQRLRYRPMGTRKLRGVPDIAPPIILIHHPVVPWPHAQRKCLGVADSRNQHPGTVILKHPWCTISKRPRPPLHLTTRIEVWTINAVNHAVSPHQNEDSHNRNHPPKQRPAHAIQNQHPTKRHCNQARNPLRANDATDNHTCQRKASGSDTHDRRILNRCRSIHGKPNGNRAAKHRKSRRITR